MAAPTPPFPGARKITLNGYSAWYSLEELREMATLPNTEEGERVGRLIHEGKVFGDATLIPSWTQEGVVAVGSGSQWDERRNTSGVRPGQP